jgi:hypothetical protein
MQSKDTSATKRSTKRGVLIRGVWGTRDQPCQIDGAIYLSPVRCSGDKFDPNKGTAFTFVSQAVMNVLCTSVTNARNSSNRFTELSDSIVDDLVVKAEDRAAVDDITHRIKAAASRPPSADGSLLRLPNQRCALS